MGPLLSEGHARQPRTLLPTFSMVPSGKHYRPMTAPFYTTLRPILQIRTNMVRAHTGGHGSFTNGRPGVLAWFRWRFLHDHLLEVTSARCFLRVFWAGTASWFRGLIAFRGPTPWFCLLALGSTSRHTLGFWRGMTFQCSQQAYPKELGHPDKVR